MLKTNKVGLWRRHVDQMRKTLENYTERTGTDKALDESFLQPLTNITAPLEPQASKSKIVKKKVVTLTP